MIKSSGVNFYTMFNNLTNPKFNIEKNISFLKKMQFLFKSYFLTLICTILSVVIIVIIDTFVVEILHQNSIWSEIRDSNSKIKFMFGRYSFLMIAIIIPLIEEIIFRLPLNLKKSSIAISLSILYLRFSGNFLTHILDLSKLKDIFNIGISIFIFLVFMINTKQEKLNLLKRNHFKLIFYFIAIGFGLIHIINFHNINYYLIFFYPFYLLPQIFMGILIGNIRIKYGFIWGWALHCLINSTSFII